VSLDFEKTIAAQKRNVDAGDESHFLFGVGGPIAGQRIELPEGAVIFGRRPDTTIQLDDPAVSGNHCRLSVIMDQLIVEDLGSTNGTFIDEEEVTEPSVCAIGSLLQIGNCLFKHELRSRDEVKEEERLAGDLEKAANYVKNLLPAPLESGSITTSWRFIPSDKLGGDAFGYHWLEEDKKFAIYLADVSGHGTAPALHSVSLINVLRKRSLPGIDFACPAEVLKALNEAYLMRDHANMYFTMFYGVFDVETRKLAFASAGHPPSMMLNLESGEGTKLFTPNLSVGMIPGAQFTDQEVDVPPGSNLYIYSDGAYEVVLENGEEWRIDEFLEMVATGPQEGVDELDRIENSVREVMLDPEFDDDFSLLIATLS
jgi:serine phosphatase RsbU (regulator of sigma subunit)